MTSNISGIPSACASTRHLIEFTAINADGTETIGVATVTEVDGKIPWSQLAAIPGFHSGDVLRTSATDPRPMLLGPGTDTPGHPAWCTTHDPEIGDGVAVCHGDNHDLDSDDEGAPALGASLTMTTGQAPRIFLATDGCVGNSTPLEMVREYALLLLSLVEQAEATSAVTR